MSVYGRVEEVHKENREPLDTKSNKNRIIVNQVVFLW